MKNDPHEGSNCYAPAKRSQHLNETCPKYCWPSICKFRPNDRNIWTLQIATLLGATCCTRLTTLLRRVATCCELKLELVRMSRRNTTNLAKRLQRHARSTNVGWKIWPFSSWSQQHMSQHVATWWLNAHNMLHPTMLRYGCVEMLRSFGRGFISTARPTVHTLIRHEVENAL